MNKIAKAFHRGQKGFTLVELLIVVAILGILAAVAIPSVSSFVKRGNVAAANVELSAVGLGGIAAAAAAGGTITPVGVTPDIPGPVAPYISGKLKGKYWLTADGSIDVTTVAVTDGTAAGHPWYPGGVTFDATTGQFQ